MNWFMNIYSPITERTDITGVLSAYDNYQYNCAAMSFQGPVYNFSKGQNSNSSVWNYAYNVNPYESSIFGNISIGGQNNSSPSFSPLGPVYNFTGGGTNGVSGTGKPASVPNRTRSNAPSRTPVNNSTAFAQKIADNAAKYVGYNEADGSFRRFSNDKEWCADFVTYVVKQTYIEQGKNPPAGFGSWRCENLKRWAIKNNKFLNTAGKPDKQDIVKNKVKPGDIVIMRENGASHTGIVKSVNRKTGDYVTIEGNVRTAKGIDAVIPVNHSPFETDVSGFIQLV